MRQKDYERFWKHIQKTETCWLWVGGKSGGGYGRFWLNGKMRLPHRVIVEHERGLIPEGLVVDHLCSVPACCRPDHLEVVTTRENNERSSSPTAIARRSGHCPRGHDHAIHGYYINGKLNRCRECRRTRLRADRIEGDD